MHNEYFGHKASEPIRIESFYSIFYFEFDDKHIDCEETHNFWEMIYVDRGDIIVTADDNVFPLLQGEIYFHKPGERHKLDVPKGQTANILILSFSSPSPAVEYFRDKKLRVDIAAKQHIASILYEAQNTFGMRLNQLLPVDSKYKCLFPLKNGIFGGEQAILLHLELMLIDFIRSENAQPVRRRVLPKDVIEDSVVMHVIDYMESHLYDNICTEDICRSLNFSKSYLSRRFMNVTNSSMMKYYTSLKIDEAKILIRRNLQSFSEISDALMFTNPHYFSRVFREIVGMTPSQYRSSIQKRQ